MPGQQQNNLIVIAGPTAVGKTRVCIELAKKLSTVVISADSRQFYKEMKIGTATPDEVETQGIKHYFICSKSIFDYYNISRYESDVIQLLDELFPLHKSIIITGGSGLYIDAVCKGIDILPDPDESIRNTLNDLYRNKGIKALQEQIKELDPDYYATADIRNPKRLLRAIEVCLATGLKYSSLRLNQRKERNFNIIKICLERQKEDIIKRISDRTDDMMKAGLLEEARQLYPHRECNALNTIGYKELFSCIEGKMSVAEAIAKIKTNTWRYAKRQITWFKRDKDYQWFAAEDTQKMLFYIQSAIYEND